jgi:hypothetical protein
VGTWSGGRRRQGGGEGGHGENRGWRPGLGHVKKAELSGLTEEVMAKSVEIGRGPTSFPRVVNKTNRNEGTKTTTVKSHTRP